MPRVEHLADLDYDPTDLDGAQERNVERQRRAVAQAVLDREHLVWLLEDARGRRHVRRVLVDAGFDPSQDSVRTAFSSDHAVMSYHEGLRMNGTRILWSILRAFATGALTPETLRLLLTENDE